MARPCPINGLCPSPPHIDGCSRSSGVCSYKEVKYPQIFVGDLVLTNPYHSDCGMVSSVSVGPQPETTATPNGFSRSQESARRLRPSMSATRQRMVAGSRAQARHGPSGVSSWPRRDSALRELASQLRESLPTTLEDMLLCTTLAQKSRPEWNVQLGRDH